MSYDTKEAARLISWSNRQIGIEPLTEAKLIEWIEGGVGGLGWQDVWEEDGEEHKAIDFRTLISLRLICLLQSAGVSSEDIGEIATLSKQELGLDSPFASSSLWQLESGGGKNVISLGSEAIDSIVGILFAHITLDGYSSGSLEFDQDGVACVWIPVEGIRIHPGIVSGSPCLAGTRIPTWVFPGMHAGGDSIEELAKDYSVPIERVKLALEWERQLSDFGV